MYHYLIPAAQLGNNSALFYHLDPPNVHALSNQDIVVNQSLSVACNATPGNPNSTTFYWTKVVDNYIPFRQNGTFLQLPFIQNASSGNYTCTAENSYSNVWKGTHNQSMVINVLCK